MEVIKGHKEIHKSFRSPVLTIGNFDGLHLGHRQIIDQVIRAAKSIGGTSVVYTFKPHPNVALKPERELQLINTYDEKLDLLEQMGVDVVIEEPFSREFSNTAPERFFSEILVKKICPNSIYVGYDFGFGKDRSGSLELLKKYCSEEMIKLDIVAPYKIEDDTCSSSRVREYILSGDVVSANKLLGREFFYRGLVVHGNGRGHKIGFATANVHTESKLKIKEGVYASLAVVVADGKSETHKSVTNVGRQPTFNESNDAPVIVETHILDFNQDLYGRILEVRMVERIRDEIKFSGVDSLIAQIKKDVQSAKKILTRKVT